MSTPISSLAKLDKYSRFQRTGVVFIPYVSSFVQVIEFFLNNTNMTFLAFLYKIDIKVFQNQQK